MQTLGCWLVKFAKGRLKAAFLGACLHLGWPKHLWLLPLLFLALLTQCTAWVSSLSRRDLDLNFTALGDQSNFFFCTFDLVESLVRLRQVAPELINERLEAAVVLLLLKLGVWLLNVPLGVLAWPDFRVEIETFVAVRGLRLSLIVQSPWVERCLLIHVLCLQ